MNGQLSMFGPKRDCLFYVDNHICGEELCELRTVRIRDPNGNYVCDNCHNYKKFVIGGYFDGNGIRGENEKIFGIPDS